MPAREDFCKHLGYEAPQNKYFHKNSTLIFLSITLHYIIIKYKLYDMQYVLNSSYPSFKCLISKEA